MPGSRKNIFVLSLFAVVLVGAWILLPSVDPAAYYNFADQRSWFGIPNTMDVLSNLAFLVVGLWGLWPAPEARDPQFRKLLALAILATAGGSIYFHLDPSVETVFWDREPLVFVFSTALGWVVADRFGTKSGLLTFWFLAIGGSISLILWRYHLGNLKPYLVLQYGGLVCGFLLLLLYRGNAETTRRFFWVFGLYALAKVCEKNDFLILDHLRILSGHTVKHLLSAVALVILLRRESKPLLFQPGRQDSA